MDVYVKNAEFRPNFNEFCFRKSTIVVYLRADCDKTDESIEMPFGAWSRVGPRKSVPGPQGYGLFGGTSHNRLRSVGNVRREPKLFAAIRYDTIRYEMIF